MAHPSTFQKLLYRLLFGTAALLLSFGSSSAQHPACATTEVNDAFAARNPAYAQSLQQQKQAWQAYQAYQAAQANSPQALIVPGAGGSVTYEIPVVFHIIHTGQAIGTPQNPSDVTIQNLVAYLNAVYAATWSANPSPGSGGVDVPSGCTHPLCTGQTFAYLWHNYRHQSRERELLGRLQCLWSGHKWFSKWCARGIGKGT